MGQRPDWWYSTVHPIRGKLHRNKTLQGEGQAVARRNSQWERVALSSSWKPGNSSQKRTDEDTDKGHSHGWQGLPHGVLVLKPRIILVASRA